MENDRYRWWLSSCVGSAQSSKNKKSVTQSDHRERKKEKAALPNRRDPAPGRATLPPVPGCLCPPWPEAGAPSTRHPVLFPPRGLAAPVRRATRAPSVPPAPLPRDSLSQDLSSPERNRLEARAPAKATWETQKCSPSLSRSQRRIRGHCRAGSRLTASLPPPQPPGARARGVVGPGTLHRERTTVPTEGGQARGEADARAAPGIDLGQDVSTNKASIFSSVKWGLE